MIMPYEYQSSRSMVGLHLRISRLSLPTPTVSVLRLQHDYIPNIQSLKSKSNALEQFALALTVKVKQAVGSCDELLVVYFTRYSFPINVNWKTQQQAAQNLGLDDTFSDSHHQYKPGTSPCEKPLSK